MLSVVAPIRLIAPTTRTMSGFIILLSLNYVSKLKKTSNSVEDDPNSSVEIGGHSDRSSSNRSLGVGRRNRFVGDPDFADRDVPIFCPNAESLNLYSLTLIKKKAK